MDARVDTDRYESLVNLADGLIGRDIYFSQAIYAEELSRVFAATWVCLGHESQIPTPHDFFGQYIGEDPVIVWRDTDHRLRVFFNSCPHRGMKICRQESGNAEAFICPYHGWTFDSRGRLVGVPHERLAFGPGFDRSSRGLLEAPRVDSYQGFIFASWNDAVPSLSDYLGPVCWYLDILATRQIGTLQVLPGQQRYRVQSNWKVAAENFAGDNYHTTHSHASAFILGLLPPNETLGDCSVAAPNGHGIAVQPIPGKRLALERVAARELGAVAVDYIETLHQKLRQELSELQAELFGLGVSTLFPHFSFNDFSALFPVQLFFWQPKGAQCMEVWQNLAFDSEAPAEIRDRVMMPFATRAQSVSGLFGQDDVENMEQVTEASRGLIARTRMPFDYTMGQGNEHPPEGAQGMPGRLGPFTTEMNQCNFYRYWLELMKAPGHHLEIS
ncbi:MAG: Rieske 2Fe-2S domain-containing protein [Pseudomonadota bacterium]|nr:Rieske 2Fe-2S domain-containing protein [Pseudomonadota bacterium]